MLAPGTRLGVYEVLAAIGHGGMGEVYRARDRRLDRTVAVKVLPGDISVIPELRQRFEREARAIASFNHPHICTLHDVGSQDGIDFLVMEYLEGETLAQRLATGALPFDQALRHGIEIADALDGAHRLGIVHRDLKPGNIMLTKAGAKLLDFGLAKNRAPAVAGRLSMLPTTPPGLTQQGTILGTFQYMAPEQLEGRDADARTDIFACGAVLHEMLTGRPAFQGQSQASLIGAILKDDPPPVSAIQPRAPYALDRLVRKCLAKDADARWQSARDLLDELKWIAEAGDQLSAVPVPAATTAGALGRWRRVAIVTAAMLLLTVLTASLTWLLTRPASPRLSRLTIMPPRAAPLSIDGVVRDLAITPDGTRLIYVGANGTQLFARALDALEPVAIYKGAPRSPFVSPDGQWVGFFEGNITLKKVAVTGGPAVTVASMDSTPRGATWLSDDTIVFATVNVTTGLQRVSAAGGTPSVMTKPDPNQGELDHLSPEALPGGRFVLFTISARTGGLDAAQVAVLDLQTSTQKVAVRGGSHAHYVNTGHLVYGAAGTLRAIAFDVPRLETRGAPVLVVPEVVTAASGAVDAVVATEGTLAYVAGGLESVQRTLVWVDRRGQETPIAAPPRPYLYPRIAPDGRQIAVFAADQESDIWVWDIDRTTLTRITFEAGLDIYPIWIANGGRLVFGSERAGGRNLFWQAVGTGAVERLSERDSVQDPTSASPDGTRIVFSQTSTTTGVDVMQLIIDDAGAAADSTQQPQASRGRIVPLVQTPLIERNGDISPDGRWLAYEANDSGQFEIYVRPYPDVNGGRWQVSTGGGTRPLWARNGQELFYVSPTGALMRVPVGRGPAWTSAAPAKLLDEGYFTSPGGNPGRTYDISPDGQRFVMIKVGEAQQTTAPQIVVVQNWLEELKRLVPTN